ncbi:hypothetical protein GWK47_041115 [Chionoecetes opilio]|uniref:Uncharacterized protein n=1 Tax=Chionoecetes opilio TaxID=41210 RepID=A0A8J4YBK3_CHIOP|nr:hypothetical protein GWK47_041115 [Chionoecetes opilio]
MLGSNPGQDEPDGRSLNTRAPVHPAVNGSQVLAGGWDPLHGVKYRCSDDSLPDDQSQDTSIPDLIVTMAKRHILIDPAQPSTSKQSRPPPRTNWELCILCQAETDEPLQCPLRSTMKPSGSGYASLTEDLLQFKGLRHMPMELNVSRLDDGDGVEATLRTHSAQWHKKCRLKFNKKMFDQQNRAESASGQQSNTGDMIAIEAKYHRSCLRALYNKIRPAALKDEDADRLHGIAFAELVVFMEDMHADEDNAPVFILSDVANLYKTRLEQLGATVTNRIHTTRLKDRLLSVLPDLRAHSQGRDTLLLFEKDIGPALKKACDHDSDAMHLVRAALVVTDAFEELLRMPSDVSEESMSLLERFVVLMYDRTSDTMEVNDARKQLFAHKSRALENIPPTQAALQQHIKRASLQGNCWNQTLVLNPELPIPSDKGGFWVAASLDDTARGIKILPRTDPLRLQEWMYRPLQVHQGCTQVH